MSNKRRLDNAESTRSSSSSSTSSTAFNQNGSESNGDQNLNSHSSPPAKRLLADDLISSRASPLPEEQITAVINELVTQLVQDADHLPFNDNNISDSSSLTNISHSSSQQNQEEETMKTDGSRSVSETNNFGDEPQPSTSRGERTKVRGALRNRLNSNDIKSKKSVNFQGVTVYYFSRNQGFTCVPSQGGSTLGMDMEHCEERSFSLEDHQEEKRKVHRQILLRRKRYARLCQKQQQQQHPHLSTLQQQQFGAPGSDSDEDSFDNISDISDTELEMDSWYFLQPVPIKQRRALLRESGVNKIDSQEKEECRDIRVSREYCGCECRLYCDPETCQCSLAGIKCQVDRLSFPCGCSRDACGNLNGRIEFNPLRVRTHLIHTIMRLGLEKKEEAQQLEEFTARSTIDLQTSSSVSNCSLIDSASHQLSDSTGTYHQPVGIFCQTFQAPESNTPTLPTIAPIASIYTSGGESSQVLQQTTSSTVSTNAITTTLLPDFLNENYDLYTQSPDATSSTYSESSECSSEDVVSENPSSVSSPSNVVTTAVAVTSMGAYPSNVLQTTSNNISEYNHTMNALSSMHYGEIHQSQVHHGPYLQSLDQASHASSAHSSMRYYGTHPDQTTVALPLSTSSSLYSNMNEYAYRTTNLYSTNSYTASNSQNSSTPCENVTATTIVSSSATLPSSHILMSSNGSLNNLNGEEGSGGDCYSTSAGCTIPSMNYFTHSISASIATNIGSNNPSEPMLIEQQHYTDLSESIASSKSADCINGLLTAASIVNELNSLSPVLVATDDPHSSSSSNSEDSLSSTSIGSAQLDNISASGESSQNDLSTQEDNFGEIIKSSIVESVTA